MADGFTLNTGVNAMKRIASVLDAADAQMHELADVGELSDSTMIAMASTIRRSLLDKVSKVLFYPDDGFPLSDGYMVGPDDGKITLYRTPNEAVDGFIEKQRRESEAMKPSAYERVGLENKEHSLGRVPKVSRPDASGLTYIFETLVFCPAMCPGWLLGAGPFVYLKNDPDPLAGPLAYLLFADRFSYSSRPSWFDQANRLELDHVQTFEFLERFDKVFGRDIAESGRPLKHEGLHVDEVPMNGRVCVSGLLGDVPWEYRTSIRPSVACRTSPRIT